MALSKDHRLRDGSYENHFPESYLKWSKLLVDRQIKAETAEQQNAGESKQSFREIDGIEGFPIKAI